MKNRWAVLAVVMAALVAAQAAPQETDPRLHSDGKGWRLERGKITDPTLPRVLLIGDSILGGYRGEVTKALAGKANVDAWINPYCQSEHYNQLLAEVLAQAPYDVIHFNMGLHGWPVGRIKEGTFEPLTKAYVQVIKYKLPKAKIIWASSTPVTVKGKPTELDGVINANIIEQNRMAAKVMAEMNVPVNDLYALLVGKLELARGDGFHWKGDAYKILSDAIVQKILAALPAEQKPAPATTSFQKLMLPINVMYAGSETRPTTTIGVSVEAVVGRVALNASSRLQRSRLQTDDLKL